MLLRNVQIVIKGFSRNFHTTKHLMMFHEQDHRRGHEPVYDERFKIEEGFVKQSLQSLRMLKEELLKLKDEMKEKFSFAPKVIYRRGEVDLIHKFNTDPKSLHSWIVTTDKDYEFGFSEAKLELSSRGTAIFSGYLDTTVPKDGELTDAGFAIMSMTPRMKSFFRVESYMWHQYTHLVFRVRGDGRTYSIHLNPARKYDVAYFDVHSYLLYTRGGPYWQYTRIPFSKFFFVGKGKVQDRQYPVCLHDIVKISISLNDKIKGPFQLEIDFIGLECDDSHTEEFAYESYRFERPMV